MKKILIVASSFPTCSNDPLPQFLREQVLAFKKVYPSVDFSVLSPHRPHTQSFFTHKNSYSDYRFHYFYPYKWEVFGSEGILPALKRNKLFYLQLPFLFCFEFIAILRVLSIEKPDIIYAHWFTPQGILSAIASFLKRVPYVFTSHAMDVKILNSIPFLGAFVVRWLVPRAKAITVVSDRPYRYLKSFFKQSEWEALENRVSIIPMGVNLDDFKTTQNRNELKYKHGFGRCPIILFVGRLAAKKGVRYLIDGFFEVLKQYPEAELVIAGEGPQAVGLKYQVARLGIEENVTFSGYISGKQKNEYYAMADVFVLPSIVSDDGDSEGFPVVSMEAAASGALIVATDAANVNAIISDRENGFIVPQKNSRALAESICAVLNLNENQRSQMQKNTQSAVKNLDWSVIIRRHYKALFE